MCGDVDEDVSEAEFESKLHARFLAHARALLPKYANDPSQGSPVGGTADITAYMETLFCDVLGRSVHDSGRVEEGHRYQRMAVQPVVFARLAGFLAGHLSPAEDPLRKVIEALLLGYGEADAMDRARQEEHHHHGDVYVRDH
jgi:hypothetical protein